MDEDLKKSELKKYEKILIKAKDLLESENLNDDISYKDFLAQIGVDEEEYKDALRTTVQAARKNLDSEKNSLEK